MRWLNFIGYLAIPAAMVVHYWLGKGASWAPTATFTLAGIGIIPLASLMGEATENLAERTGPTWGGLLNATFGNAAELIIGIIAVSKGLTDVAKASLTGSILGNLLLVGGGAMLVGGWGRERQQFSRASVEASAGLLVVAVAAMLFPAIFHFSFLQHDTLLIKHESGISVGASVILLLVYGLGLLFTLRTHSHIFSPEPAQSPEDPAGFSGGWSVRKSVVMLLIASTAVAFLSEMLVGSVEQMAHHLGWNQIFVGVILLAIVGNAAEHSTALMLARRNDMDTAMTIVFQSGLQIALFVTPALVLLSEALAALKIGEAKPMNLVFSPLEVVAVFISVIVVMTLCRNGESNWFEGTLLMAVYAILAITFFYIPAGHSSGYDGAVPGAQSRPAVEEPSHAAAGQPTGAP
jgi:Ca2+:H+ antiporter